MLRCLVGGLSVGLFFVNVVVVCSLALRVWLFPYLLVCLVVLLFVYVIVWVVACLHVFVGGGGLVVWLAVCVSLCVLFVRLRI